MPAANRRPAPMTAEQRAAKVEALTQRLTAAVEELTEGEAWTAMLRVSARLHRYSFRNVVLLHAQAAERGMTLTTVAGFTTWKSLGRSVRKGEKGLAVLAPITRRAGEDPATPAGDGASGRRVIRGMRVAHVFDLSQTDGEPLPEPHRPAWLSGRDTVGLWDALVALVSAAGYELQRRPEVGEGQGWTDHADYVVSVRPDIDGARATAVLAHELGHIRAGHAVRDISRAQRETEAESIAHVVLGASGLDSAVSAVPYVAGWSRGDHAVIAAAAETVHSTASAILTDLAQLAADADVAPREQLPSVNSPYRTTVARRRRSPATVRGQFLGVSKADEPSGSRVSDGRGGAARRGHGVVAAPRRAAAVGAGQWRPASSPLGAGSLRKSVRRRRPRNGRRKRGTTTGQPHDGHRRSQDRPGPHVSRGPCFWEREEQ